MAGLGPCIFCGAVDYPMSVGGPTICPACDCGDFGPQRVRQLGAFIADLQQRLQLAERLARVDFALARQLTRSMEINANLRARIAELETGR